MGAFNNNIMQPEALTPLKSPEITRQLHQSCRPVEDHFQQDNNGKYKVSFRCLNVPVVASSSVSREREQKRLQGECETRMALLWQEDGKPIVSLSGLTCDGVCQ